MSNPLTELGWNIPFNAIRAEHVEPAISALIERARADLAALGAVETPTWETTAGALEALTAGIETAMGVVDHLESVLDDAGLRAACNQVRPQVSAFYADLALDPGCYTALRRFAATPEADALDPVRRRYLDETLADLRRGGAELPDDLKAELKDVEVALSRVTTRYAQNVVDASDAWSLVLDDAAGLRGLPARAIDAARADAAAHGLSGYRLSLAYPSYIPVMQFAEDAGLRETVWRAFNTRASSGEHDNRGLVTDILALRARKARLLGYADVADLFLEPRMARDGATAAAFVADLRARTAPFFDGERDDLQAFRDEVEAESAPLQPWDLAFYAEKLRRARFDFDGEALRPWLAADSVLAGLFSILERLYGVAVEALPQAEVWHPDVRAYALVEGGRQVGVFYADLFPRAGKRSGAWMRPLYTGDPANGGDPHVGLICGNLTPPLGDRPALLSHGEVETLFHEFGHLMHHLLTDVPVRSLAGTNVAWDFVELPSQIMENWTWEREALDLFARHYETGEPLPASLFDRMVAARCFRSADAQMRQLGFATLDLSLHREYDPEAGGDIVAYTRGVLADFTAAPLPDDFALVTSFNHLFASPTGYAAAYYSYKWAEVLDADAFSRFRAAGLFSREEGLRFRHTILARGNSADPAALYRDFMGRDPDPDALMARAGLLGGSAA
ncbi:MAG: M3 family metallopeptidase [Myxococcales bacterium]|nr:M3 family metallopeptidase [Myxococcales bacterium]